MKLNQESVSGTTQFMENFVGHHEVWNINDGDLNLQQTAKELNFESINLTSISCYLLCC